MRSKICCLVFFTLLFSVPCYGTGGHRLDHQCILFVQPGDSYIGLFGADWLRVFETNTTGPDFESGNGTSNRNPDKLVVGTRLVVPKGTYLTDRATERLSRYRDNKKAALSAVRKAESFVGSALLEESEPYKQALALLAKARDAIKGVTFGFENYLEATKLAQEAIERFEIAGDLQRSKRDTLQLRERINRERSLRNKRLGEFPRQRAAFLGLMVVLLLSLLWVIRQRKKREMISSAKIWLEQQRERLNTLESMDV
ncbi:MAG: hypothetical protein J7M32_09215 [Deltaproteobacteria bacterium]|nr:hypothetical protein [Deltaproteobacteria bacterium]